MQMWRQLYLNNKVSSKAGICKSSGDKPVEKLKCFLFFQRELSKEQICGFSIVKLAVELMKNYIACVMFNALCLMRYV